MQRASLFLELPEADPCPPTCLKPHLISARITLTLPSLPLSLQSVREHLGVTQKLLKVAHHALPY